MFQHAASRGTPPVCVTPSKGTQSQSAEHRAPRIAEASLATQAATALSTSRINPLQYYMLDALDNEGLTAQRLRQWTRQERRCKWVDIQYLMRGGANKYRFFDSFTFSSQGRSGCVRYCLGLPRFGLGDRSAKTAMAYEIGTKANLGMKFTLADNRTETLDGVYVDGVFTTTSSPWLQRFRVRA